MTTGLQPYPAYKPSGSEWLGDVPAHWGVRRLKAHLLLNDSGVWGEAFDEQGVIVLRSTEQTVDGGWRISNPAKIRLSEAERVSASLKEHDLLVTKSSGSSAHIGKTSIVTTRIAAMNCCFSNFMQRIRLDAQTTPLLIWYILNSRVGREQLTFESTTTTGLGNLNAKIIEDCYLSFPPLPEQRAIVRYLDHVDRRIRRYVAAKRKLIALLEEEKQAVVNRAVTRGLDPNVRLKPSGVEWLGDVPEHWEVTKLARVVHSSNAGEVIDKGWWDRGTGVLYTCARQAVLSDYVSFPLAKRTTGLDLLLTRNGTPYVHRPVANAIYSNVVQRITLAAGTEREWIALTLEASARGMKGYGVSIESLNYDMWKVLVVLVPPKDEQTAIVEHLDKTTAAIDAAIVRAQRQIELLQEYRTRLIADVVTGKLDVREAAARLPDEGDDQDPIEESGPLADGLDDALYDIDESVEKLAIESEVTA